MQDEFGTILVRIDRRYKVRLDDISLLAIEITENVRNLNTQSIENKGEENTEAMTDFNEYTAKIVENPLIAAPKNYLDGLILDSSNAASSIQELHRQCRYSHTRFCNARMRIGIFPDENDEMQILDLINDIFSKSSELINKIIEKKQENNVSIEEIRKLVLEEISRIEISEISDETKELNEKVESILSTLKLEDDIEEYESWVDHFRWGFDPQGKAFDTFKKHIAPKIYEITKKNKEK